VRVGLAVRVVLVGLLAATADGRADVEHPGYVVHATVPLSKQVDGVDGRLELLEDARFTPEVRARFWGNMDDAMYCAARNDTNQTFCASAEREPLRRALLRLVGDGDRELAVETQERDLGELRVERLHGEHARPSYAVTIDYSVGMGTYNGPLTRLAEIRDGRLLWLRSVDAQGKHPEVLRLPSTGRSAWKIVQGGKAGTRDILLVASQPDLENAASGVAELPFVQTLTRFSFDGTRWRRHQRRSPGYWDSIDEPFPERARFP